MVLLKKNIVFIIFLLLLSTLNSVSSTPIINTAVSIDDWLEYEVKESSNSTNGFYGAWPPGTFYGNWSVIEDDFIRFQVIKSDENGINGTLILGSTNFTNVRNIDVASALTLSIYPWYGGFFANSSNWPDIDASIQNTNTTTSSTSNRPYELNNTKLFFTIKIYETIDYYGQNSILEYDLNSGILLKARTSFGNYLLDIALVNTNLGIGSLTRTLNSPFLVTTLLIICLISVIRVFQFRKKKKLY